MPSADTAKMNKMAVMHPAKLLLNMGLPMMLSMVSLALYNFVDTYFVSIIPDTAAISDFGDKAVNAITLAHPIQVLMISLGVGFGVGINTFCAFSFGKNDRKKVSYGAGNAFLIAFALYILFLLFGIIGAGAFIRSQTSDPVIAQLGTTYLSIVTIASLGTLGHMCVEKFVMATGRTVYTMIVQLTGAIINIILDPILIFGFAFIPPLGIAGAAIATVIGQFASFFMITFFVLKKCPEIDKGFAYLKPDPEVLRKIFAIAGPAILMQIMYPIMGYGLNLILGTISVSAVTAYGVYSRLEYFMTMLVLGMNNASIPSTAFNRGQGSWSRVRQLIKYSQLYGAVIMTFAIIVSQVFADPIVSLFNITQESHRICITAIHIISCGYYFLGSNLLLQGTCQALGKGVRTMIITFIRSILVVLPLAFLLSHLSNAGTFVWIAIPIAELCACAVGVILTVSAYRKLSG